VLGYEVEEIARVPLPTTISVNLSVQTIVPTVHFDSNCASSGDVEEQVVVGLRAVRIASRVKTR
jgi:hypothetical protein